MSHEKASVRAKRLEQENAFLRRENKALRDVVYPLRGEAADAGLISGVQYCRMVRAVHAHQPWSLLDK